MKEFDHDMISRYLDGDMNADELKAFELLMQQDPDLGNEVELVRDVSAVLKMKLHPDANELALRDSVKQMSQHYFVRKEGGRIVPLGRQRWIMAVAAVFILGLILTVWSPWNKGGLYKQYASIQMPGVAERGNAADSLLKSAAGHFNKQEYAKAIPLFEAILKDSSQHAFAEYYYSIALLQYGESQRSRDHFMSLYNGGSVFKYDAAFYMALSYLKEKDKTRCKEWLNRVPAGSGPYEKAQELLKKL